MATHFRNPGVDMSNTMPIVILQRLGEYPRDGGTPGYIASPDGLARLCHHRAGLEGQRQRIELHTRRAIPVRVEAVQAVRRHLPHRARPVAAHGDSHSCGGITPPTRGAASYWAKRTTPTRGWSRPAASHWLKWKPLLGVSRLSWRSVILMLTGRSIRAMGRIRNDSIDTPPARQSG